MSLPLRALTRSSVASQCFRTVAAARPVVRTNMVTRALSITYSGGQATEGQGGYYGSGGARAAPENQTHHSDEERAKMLAMAADVEKLTHIMNELDTLENILEREETDSKGEVSGRSIEIKSSIKKLMTNPEVLDCLGRLEFNGAPVWGLSMNERNLVESAREWVNKC